MDRNTLSWALARYDVDCEPEKYGMTFLYYGSEMTDEEQDALADKHAFMFEAKANWLIGYIRRYEEQGRPTSASVCQDPDLKVESRFPKLHQMLVSTDIDDGDQDTRV